MKAHCIWFILVCLHFTSSFHLKQYSFFKNLQKNQNEYRYNHQIGTLFAKKKFQVSEEVLQQVQEHLAQREKDKQSETPQDSKPLKPGKEEKKNKDKKKNKNKGNNQRPGSDDDEEGDETHINKGKTNLADESKSKPEEKTKLKSKYTSRAKFASLTQPSFVSLGIDEVEVVFANNRVLRNASFAVATGDRVGLVGPNGSGKSTILKLLMGNVTANRGNIQKTPPLLRISHLKQEFIDELTMNNTLHDELLTSFAEQRRALQELHELQAQASTFNYMDDPDATDEYFNQVREVQSYAKAIGAFTLDAKILKVIDSIGFQVEDLNRTVSTFSGGWKMRIGLSKLLCTDPNILLLDEPTNHLDFESVIWLESFLRNQTIPMVVVSHDREFLNQICTKIIDVEEGHTITYQGNYNQFLEQRKNRWKVWREKYDKQSRFIQEEERWIRKSRNEASITASAIRQREQALERLKVSKEFLLPPPKDRKFRFRFPYIQKNSPLVVEAKCMSFAYNAMSLDEEEEMMVNDLEDEENEGNEGENENEEQEKQLDDQATMTKDQATTTTIVDPEILSASTAEEQEEQPLSFQPQEKLRLVLQDINFEIAKGDRIGFIGPNGSGKSTMVKLILGDLRPTQGFCSLGSAGITINYYAQNQADTLDLSKTVLQTMHDVLDATAGVYKEEELRALLGQFMFKGDDVYKEVGVLSGGEKARVALCRMMLTPANLLILDEPTNHLDITAREVLEDALMNYPGSVIIVSHDRFFISQVVNTIFAFDRVQSETGEIALEEVEEAEAPIDDLELYRRTKNMPLWNAYEFGDPDQQKGIEVEDDATTNEEEESVAEGEEDESVTVYNNRNAYEINRYDCDYYQYLEFMAKRQLGEEDDEYEDEEYAEEEYEDEGEEEAESESEEEGGGRGGRGGISDEERTQMMMHEQQTETIKDRMTSRYIAADTKYRIAPAKKIMIPFEERSSRSRNFGGSGVTCGDKFKGIKNAKRFHGNA